MFEKLKRSLKSEKKKKRETSLEEEGISLMEATGSSTPQISLEEVEPSLETGRRAQAGVQERGVEKIEYEQKVEQKASSTTTTNTTMSTSAESSEGLSILSIFKSEFLQYLVRKAVEDRHLRDIILRRATEMTKEDLKEMIGVLFNIIDELKQEKMRREQRPEVVEIRETSGISQRTVEETRQRTERKPEEKEAIIEGFSGEEELTLG